MKVDRKDFDVIAGFLRTMKGLDPDRSEWNVRLGPIAQDTTTLDFKRFIYVDGEVVEVTPDPRGS